MNHDRPGPAPFFVVGAPRSGTTLLRLMNNQHPEIAVPPESWFVPELMDQLPVDRALTAAERDRAIDHITRHTQWQDWGLDAGELRQRAARLDQPTLATLVTVVYRQAAERSGKPRWGDKTPFYLTEIARIDALFPSAQFLHIIRDARDCCLSYQKLRWHGAFLFRFASYWDRWLRKAIEVGRKLPPTRYMELRYEDLVLRPEYELRRVCVFLGITYHPAMLSYHQTALDHIAPREQRAGFHEMLIQPLQVDLVEHWRRDMPWYDVITVEAMAAGAMTPVGQGLAYPRLSHLLRLVFWLPDRLLTATLPLRKRIGLTQSKR